MAAAEHQAMRSLVNASNRTTPIISASLPPSTDEYAMIDSAIVRAHQHNADAESSIVPNIPAHISCASFPQDIRTFTLR